MKIIKVPHRNLAKRLKYRNKKIISSKNKEKTWEE
jgi:hypothetical protein